MGVDHHRKEEEDRHLEEEEDHRLEEEEVHYLEEEDYHLEEVAYLALVVVWMVWEEVVEC